MGDFFTIFLLRIFRFFGIIAFISIVLISICSIVIVSSNLFFEYNYYEAIKTFLFFMYDLFSISDLNNNGLIIIIKKLITIVCSIVFLFGFILVYIQIIDMPIKDKFRYTIRALLFMNVRDRKEDK